MTPASCFRSAAPGRIAVLRRRLAALACAALVTGAAPATAPPPAGTPHPAAPPKTAPKPAATTKPPAAKPSGRTALQQAAEARGLEDLGAYRQAAAALRELRRRIPADADLEIALAMDEARGGELDSAAARLWSPVLTATLADSMPVARRHPYGWEREKQWVNGRFDGWHWYVVRARAEVAARLGRWTEARDAARAAVAAHPLSGKEWLILAVCAGHAGDLEEADHAARRAAWLDPTLPEAFYLTGVLDWRAGRRSAAHERFRAAVALDSSYREPAIALVRSLLPGVAPDTLPGQLLTGVRAVGLVSSPARPKLEEFVQMDTPATIINQDLLPLPDSLKGRAPQVKMYLPVLVDERGRAVLHELPYATPEQLPEPIERLTLLPIPGWRFQPATKHGQPGRVWANAQITYNP